MKSINQSIRKVIIVPLICFSTVIFGQAEFNAVGYKDAISPGAVEFVKSDGGMLVFTVSLSGLPAKGCQLKITNENGEVIYEDRISSDNYKKTFRIERNNFSKINFEANGKNYRFNESFNVRVRVEEKLVVTKL